MKRALIAPLLRFSSRLSAGLSSRLLAEFSSRLSPGISAGLVLSAGLGFSLSGCATSHESAPLEAPNVHFQKALVMAEAPLEKRKEIERMVADEMQRRRPHVQVVLSSDQFPDIEHVSRENFLAYLQNYEIDLVMTITPFAEVMSQRYGQWTAIKNEELGEHVVHAQAATMTGRYGVQVIGWDTKTRKPVYAKKSETLLGASASPQGVATFAVTTVSREM